MASNSCFYDATIYKTVDGQVTYSFEQVDLLNLAALDFDKIVINGDVSLGNGKGKPLPDLSKVEINGEFDCSSFSILADSVMPEGITALRCLYSFNSLAVLKGMLPSTVKTLYVRNAIINSVQKDEEALQTAQEFLSVFPEVEVIGKTETLRLRDVIQKKQVKEKKTVASKSSVRSVVKNVKESTSSRIGFLSIADAALRIKEFPEFQKVGIKDIKKQLKTFMYEHDDDIRWGNVQNYVLESTIPELVVELLKSVDNAGAVVGENNVAQVETVEKKIEIKQEVEEVKKSEKTESEDLKPVVIKKFFDKRIWAAVCKTVKSNKALLLKFLHNINDVNLNPVQKDMRVGAGRVACVKKGELKLVPNLELKNSCYIAQGFGRDNNRPRVIWCVLQNGEWVASAFYPNHGDGKNKCAYNSAILSNALRDKTAANFADNRQNYIDVETLLSDFLNESEKDLANAKGSEKDIVPTSVVEIDKTVEKAVAEPEALPEPENIPSDNVGVVKESVIAQPLPQKEEVASIPEQVSELPEVKDIVKTKRPRIRRVVKGDTDVLPEPEKSLEIYTKEDFLYQMNYSFEDVFSLMNKDIFEIKQKLMSETDTEKSLELAKQLSEKLQDKQTIEQNMQVAKKTFDLFKQYMSIQMVRKKGKTL